MTVAIGTPLLVIGGSPFPVVVLLVLTAAIAVTMTRIPQRVSLAEDANAAPRREVWHGWRAHTSF